MITCYEQPTKEKSQRVLRAFAAGCGGRISNTTARELEPGPAAFYGVREPWLHLWRQAIREGRDWYFIDNSYFDCVREEQFRVTKNALQHTGLGESDGKRFAALGIQIKPMRDNGRNVIICPSSPEFMSVIANDPGWLERVTEECRRRYGWEHVIVRTKQEKRPLLVDLQNAMLLVTWGSAAAVTALLDGVRVLCAPECCATYAHDRLQWAGVLADQQWTLEEMRNGTARRMLNGG